MKDIFIEYIWFVITLFGTMIGLQMMFFLFFGDSGAVYKIVNTVLGGLM